MARTGASKVDAIRVEVTGQRELQGALRRMGADLKDFTKINRAAAEEVAATARQRAPHRTGRLARTIRSGATQKRGTVSAGGGTGRNLVEYAGPIHFGWFRRNIDPQPFIYDALDSRRDEVVRRYEDQVSALVARVGRETP